ENRRNLWIEPQNLRALRALVRNLLMTTAGSHLMENQICENRRNLWIEPQNLRALRALVRNLLMTTTVSHLMENPKSAKIGEICGSNPKTFVPFVPL
ncbi:MAG: hypothetical protein AAGK14_14670, partial [Verrucomicrobiota bacterium]